MKTRDILIAVYEDRAYRRTTGSCPLRLNALCACNARANL